MATLVTGLPQDTAAKGPPEANRSFKFQEMRLKVGDRVQVEPPKQAGSGRASALVVGWVEDQCLIVTGPQVRARRIHLQAGEMVVVRVFTGCSAFAFACTVLKTTLTRADYLYLSFPASISGVDVRSSPRFRLCLPAKAAAQGSEAMDATIDNMGATGALVVCAHPLGALGEQIKLEFDVLLHEVPVALSLQAAIRSVDDAADGVHRYGVSFVDPSANDRLILAALMWFNMYENPKLGI